MCVKVERMGFEVKFYDDARFGEICRVIRRDGRKATGYEVPVDGRTRDEAADEAVRLLSMSSLCPTKRGKDG